MKAVRVHEPGGPEKMRLEELPEPQPGSGQVRVRIGAAGVNFIDIYQRSGQYKVGLPYALGLEGAGVVEALGPGVEGLAVGDRVAWNGVSGSYATEALVPADKAVPLPQKLGFEEGAAAMLQGMTAHYLAYTTCPLMPGDRCLVHAAAGGVGLLLCQMAKACGAEVFGTVSTEEKAALAREAGADHLILYTRQDFEAEVRRLTGGQGVDVVYDSVGRDTFDKSLGCLRPRGMMVLYGQSSGPVPPFDCQVLNAKGSLFLTRPSLFHYVATRQELVERSGAVFGWIAEGRLRLRIGGRFPLAEAARAHEELASRRTTGKLLLVP
jgi:NADPH2:quinone reductase